MRRSFVVFAIWLIGVAIATTIAWNAVQLVGSEVTDETAGPLSPASLTGVADPPTPTGRASATPTRSPSATPTRTTSPGTQTRPPRSAPPSPPPSSSRAPVTRTWTTQGGSTAMSCTGSRLTLRYASPNTGFEVDVNRSGDEIEVRFRSDDHESRVRVECLSGTPVGEVREDD